MDKKAKFNKGLKKNSIFVLLLALVLTFLLIIFLEAQMDKGLITDLYREAEYIASSEEHFGHTVYTLTEYKDTRPDNYAIYFLGGSSAGTIFYSKNYLEDKIKETYNEDVHAEVLFTNGQTYLDALLIIENLPDDAGAVVLSSVAVKLDHPAGLSYGTAMKNMPVKGDVFYDTVLKYYPGDGNQIYKFKAGHLVKRLIDRVFEYPYSFIKSFDYILGADVDETLPVLVVEPDVYNRKIVGAQNRLNRIDEQDITEFNDIIGIMAQLCKEKGLELILISLSYDEEIIGDIRFNGQNINELFQEKNKEAAEKYDNVTYLSYVNELGIEHEDYADIKHVVAYDKRRAYMDGFVANTGFLFD